MIFQNITFDYRAALEVSGSVPDSYDAKVKSTLASGAKGFTYTGILEFCKQFENEDCDRDLYIIAFREYIDDPNVSNAYSNLDFECSVIFPSGDKKLGTYVPETRWYMQYFTLDKQFRVGEGYTSFFAFYNDSRRILGAQSCSVPEFNSTDEVAEKFISVMKERGIRMTSIKLRWYALMKKIFHWLCRYSDKKTVEYDFAHKEELTNLRKRLYGYTGNIDTSTRMGV
jgi:hypothetical protein